MNQRTLRRLTVLAVLVLSLVAMGEGVVRIARYQAHFSQQALQRNAEELQSILARFRKKDREPSSDVWQRFEDWMARNVGRGRTTEMDIVTCFGKDSQSLDRPDRDHIRTIEYTLYGDQSYGKIVMFDFDSRTAILQDWHFTYYYCGFCPHVLADDGQWRLEGKLLPGRIGPQREGSDTLLLPRLLPRNQTLGIRLANWAPEMEHIDQVQLGVVPCESGYDIDLDDKGNPYIWKASGDVEVEPIWQKDTRPGWRLSVGEPAAGRVLVLEVRNTGEFESAMREAVFRPGAPWPLADLVLRFDDGTCREIQPVGTKFLRRIVVLVPPEVHSLAIAAPANMWWIRRAWLGHGHLAQDVAWLAATEANGGKANALGLLRDRDEQRLALVPMQEVDLRFTASEAVVEKRGHRFVLRMWGYYEFLPTAGNGTP